MEALNSQPSTGETYESELIAYNNVTTWLAEGLNGSMRTPFEFVFDGYDIYSEAGESLSKFFENGVIEAQATAINQPELAFEVRRRLIEADELIDMLKMAQGELPNVMVVVSDFPPELVDATAHVGGYNISRKQAMLRLITKSADGRLKIYSQSLDGNNRQALEAIYASLGFRPQLGELLPQRMHIDIDESVHNLVIDNLMAVHDNDLETQTAVKHYAGQRQLLNRQNIDTYNFACGQADLIDRAVSKVLMGTFDDKAKYETIATLDVRYENACRGIGSIMLDMYQTRSSDVSREFEQLLEQEIQQATSQAKAEGKIFSGCGTTVGSNSEKAAAEQLTEAGYGNKVGEDKYGSRTFKCPNGHINKRPYNKLLKSCQHSGCKAVVACK